MRNIDVEYMEKNSSLENPPEAADDDLMNNWSEVGKMDIKGKFFPVGHGLTYAFKIGDVSGVNDVHLLYDINRKCDMKELENFYGNKVIDYLILSHLHADHMDGVGKLCKAGFKVKKIYIPYLDNDEKIFVEMRWAFSTGNYRSYQDIVNQFLNLGILENIENINVVEEQTSFTIGDGLWEFNIFQNKGNSAAVVNDIRARLYRKGINSANIQSMLNNRIGISDIRAVYNASMRKHNFELNETSIFLEHGPLIDKIKIVGINGYEFLTRKIRADAGMGAHSLITGDMNLNEKKNECIIGNYYNKLGVVLVPHHSGVHEWSTHVCQNMHVCPNMHLVVWVVSISEIGIRPYGKVVKDIYDNGQKLYICDKNYSFEYIYRYV